MKRLSSGLTLFWKLFPVLLAAPFAIGAARLLWEWLLGTRHIFAGVNPFGILIFVPLLAWAFYMLAPLKRVYLESGALRVSNYVREVVIPLAAVEHVSQPDLSSHRRITITLRVPSEFGDRIVFMPRFFFASQAAEEIRNGAALSKAEAA